MSKSKKISINPMAFHIGVYRILEDKQLQLPYGMVSFRSGSTIVCPHFLPIQKKLIGELGNYANYYQPGTNLNQKKILVIRYGGIGDILCTIPILLELKEKYPSCQIGYMCSPNYADVLDPYTSIISSYLRPITNVQSFREFDYFVSLDGMLEHYPNKNENIHDIYAKSFKINITNESIQKVIKLSNTKNRLGIGIQYTTNAPIRNYNIDNICDLINQLDKITQEPIYLLGKANDFLPVNYISAQTNGRAIFNGCNSTEFTLKDTVNIIKNLKVLIGPDSSMVHIAGLNDTPFIGLYGPFSAESRIKYYNNAIGIEGRSTCSPCNRHMPIAWCKYTGGEGMCLNKISPQTIVDNTRLFI